MKKVLGLRGLIHSKYPNESQFAQALGWSRQRLNRITNGRKEPDIEEIVELAAALGVNVEKIVGFFWNASHQ